MECDYISRWPKSHSEFIKTKLAGLEPFKGSGDTYFSVIALYILLNKDWLFDAGIAYFEDDELLFHGFINSKNERYVSFSVDAGKHFIESVRNAVHGKV